eukprot:UN24887
MTEKQNLVLNSSNDRESTYSDSIESRTESPEPMVFPKLNRTQSKWGFKHIVYAVFALLGFYFLVNKLTQSGQRQRLYRVLTWNTAAVNNNPFEYYVTYDEEPAYAKLMLDVENFIENPVERDIPVSEVFTDEMFDILKKHMEEQNWKGVDIVEEFWKEDYRNRKIVSEYLKDKDLGSKRLASMPDRVTNTLNLANGSQIYRPTVINLFEGDLSTQDKWFEEWSTFMFKTPVKVQADDEETMICELLLPISSKKYPAITEKEESVSIPLSTLCAAIFDAILVHMLNSVAPGKWSGIKKSLGDKLNRGKLTRTVEILEKTYEDTDIMFLQEVSAAFVDKFDSTGLNNNYDLIFPEKLDGKRDQNSMILVQKGM